MLVTGAGGFIGRRLVQAISARGACVTRLFHGCEGRKFQQGVGWLAAGITDLGDMAHAVGDGDFELVFHLAAVNTNRGSRFPAYGVFETNLRGTYTVLEAARMAGKQPKVVVFSSREVEPLLRRDPDGPTHPYAASKLGAELAAAAYADTCGLDVSIIRTGNAYGPGDLNFGRLIPAVILSLLTGERPVIKGPPEAVRDYIYIDDLIAASMETAERANGNVRGERVHRLATGVQTTTASVVRKLLKLAGWKDVDPFPGVPFGGERTDEYHIPARSGSSPEKWSGVSLDEGLVRTFAWYQRIFRRFGGSALRELGKGHP